MRLNISDWLNRQRGQWREWVGWLILICYAALLFGNDRIQIPAADKPSEKC